LGFTHPGISILATGMPTIGILLPGSTLYPSIGIDFLLGIRSCYNFHKFTDIDIQVSTIGFGLKDDEIYKEAEKFLLINNADVVVVYAEDYHANKLSPLFAAAGKLLVICNAGANYPIATGNISHTVFHSFNDCLCSFLTGKYCAGQEGGHEAILATSFFDGGYRHFHAMNNAFVLSGGEIKYNFVSHYKKEEFNTEALAAFIKENPGIRKLMAVFCGDMARFFYKKMEPVQKEFNLQWYGSPMMFDCTAGDFEESKPFVQKISGYTSWVPVLDNESNRGLNFFYRENNGKDPNLFSMQGWENGLLLMEYFQQRKDANNTESAINQLVNKKISSPRGTIFVNENRLVLGPAYLVHATNGLEITVEETITDVSEALEEMLSQIPDAEFSSWRNTYLCI
jgi:branched-chain amino acid transport system substrate-binding protein